jgi:Fe-S-cluster-containing dehydrogenase component
VRETHKPVSIDYLPFPTDLCDLCAARTGRGEKPSCVKHCQADCMRYSPISEMAQEMAKRPKTVLFKPLQQLF